MSNENDNADEWKDKNEEEGEEKKKNQLQVNEDENKKHEKPGPSESGKSASQKVIRFQVSQTSLSDESFTSAQSYTLQENEDEYEDFTEPPVSFLKKFVFSPLRHSQPRKVSRHRFSVLSDNSILIIPTSSSRQLYEILRNSPSPSDADIHLINATHLRKLKAVKEAISNGADVNTYKDGESPLLIATEIGDHRLVAYLLTVPNINPDFQNNFGQTPLNVAVRNGFIKIMRLLLNNNADVNISDHMGKCPLHEALFQQRPSLVKLLLAYGADVEKVDCFGEKPIYTSAVKRRHLECLITLLKMGAGVNYINITGIPLLSRAILNGTQYPIIEALIQFGASVNAQDLVSKKAPLHFTVIQNDINLAKLLVRHGADVNLKTIYNFTPFDEAVFQKSLNLAAYLKEVMDRKKIIQSMPPIRSFHPHKKKQGLKTLNKTQFKK